VLYDLLVSIIVLSEVMEDKTGDKDGIK